jgi:hypothetical protein
VFFPRSGYDSPPSSNQLTEDGFQGLGGHQALPPMMQRPLIDNQYCFRHRAISRIEPLDLEEFDAWVFTSFSRVPIVRFELLVAFQQVDIKRTKLATSELECICKFIVKGGTRDAVSLKHYMINEVIPMPCTLLVCVGRRMDSLLCAKRPLLSTKSLN